MPFSYEKGAHLRSAGYLLVFVLFDLRVRRVALHAVDAVQAGLLAVIRLAAGSDDLAVCRAKAETIALGLVHIDLELRMLDLCKAFFCRILNLGDRGILLDACDTRAAALLALVYFRCGDRLAIARLQVKLNACRGIPDDKLSHDLSLLCARSARVYADRSITQNLIHSKKFGEIPSLTAWYANNGNARHTTNAW